jgi:large subunit ribosomal protein L5
VIEVTMARLKTKYKDDVVPAMIKEFAYTNPMQVPKLNKITINVGLGEATQNAKAIDSTVIDITAITGQKPVVTKSKKAIANFKLRENLPIGVMVTLRRDRMYEFLDRVIHTALPRVRDFKGISDKSFDGRGNYSLGLREQIIFPEIQADKVDKTRGMTITIATTANTDQEGRVLLRLMGMPFAS